MATFAHKVRTVAQSFVTYAGLAVIAITVVMSEMQTSGVLPDAALGYVLQYGTTAVAALGAIVAIIKRVMPVPIEGMQVVLDDDSTVDVVQGW